MWQEVLFFYSDRLCDADFWKHDFRRTGADFRVFHFSVDYSKAEKFQYEDDEYYYYVKAIPKVSVAVPEKRVKKDQQAEDGSEKA